MATARSSSSRARSRAAARRLASRRTFSRATFARRRRIDVCCAMCRSSAMTVCASRRRTDRATGTRRAFSPCRSPARGLSGAWVSGCAAWGDSTRSRARRIQVVVISRKSPRGVISWARSRSIPRRSRPKSQVGNRPRPSPMRSHARASRCARSSGKASCRDLLTTTPTVSDRCSSRSSSAMSKRAIARSRIRFARSGSRTSSRSRGSTSRCSGGSWRRSRGSCFAMSVGARRLSHSRRSSRCG